MRYFCAIALITIALFTACNKIEPPVVDNSLAYYPTEVGKWLIYQADSLVVDRFQEITYEVNFFVKEEIVDQFTDSQGRPSVKIDRSYSSDGKNFKRRDTWLASKDSSSVERVEENVRFLTLAFPLRVGKQWEGTAYLNESSGAFFPSNNSNWDWDWDYTVSSDTETYTNGDLSFTNVIQIEQQPSETQTAIRKTLGVEQYAKGIGLVFKQLTILLDDDNDLSGEWPDKALEGYIYQQRLIDHN